MNKHKLNLRLELSEERKEKISSRKPDILSSTPRMNTESTPRGIPKPVKSSRGIPMLPIGKLITNSTGRSNQITSSRARLPSGKTVSENVSLVMNEESVIFNSSGVLSNFNYTSKVSYKTLDLTSPRPIKETVPQISELKLPSTSVAILKNFKSYLSTYEQAEILDYNEIHFLGANSKKNMNLNGPNHGFDDERGDYRVVLGDHMAYRYETSNQLGKGSFGQVFKAYDHKNKEYVALKIIRNKSRFHQQGAIEVKVLRALKDHDPQDRYNVIHIKDYFVFRKHLCISFELLSINLYEFIKSNHFHGLSCPLIRRFAYQILQCLKLSHRMGIIHCDLKPENILLRQSNKSSLKVIDFGSSCYDDQKLYTYIQSRFYRAPEIMLGIPYTTAIDM